LVTPPGTASIATKACDVVVPPVDTLLAVRETHLLTGLYVCSTPWEK